MKKKAIIVCIIFLLLIVCGTILLFVKNNTYSEKPDIVSEYVENNEELTELDKFYKNDIIGNYKDIRELDERYTREEARIDNCFVIGAMVHNDNLYNEFMKKYKKKESGFIRVVQNTAEGDLVIYDIMYNDSSKELLLVSDSTRDKFSNENDRIIKLEKYDNVAEYKYKECLYWVLHNGKLSDEAFDTGDVFVITTIN